MADRRAACAALGHASSARPDRALAFRFHCSKDVQAGPSVSSETHELLQRPQAACTVPFDIEFTLEATDRIDASSEFSPEQNARMADQDHYTALEIAPTADRAEIRKAHRRLALANHPDRTNGDATAEARFKVIQEAYEVLSDPEKRKKYDLTRAGTKERPIDLSGGPEPKAGRSADGSNARPRFRRTGAVPKPPRQPGASRAASNPKAAGTGTSTDPIDLTGGSGAPSAASGSASTSRSRPAGPSARNGPSAPAKAASARADEREFDQFWKDIPPQEIEKIYRNIGGGASTSKASRSDQSGKADDPIDLTGSPAGKTNSDSSAKPKRGRDDDDPGSAAPSAKRQARDDLYPERNRARGRG